MPDPEYWKKRYKNKWHDGIRRAEKIIKILNSFGFEVKDYGFLSRSDEYSKENPSEKGIPDFELTRNDKTVCLLEITGTDKMIGPDIWVRPDKFDYAENHKNSHCWLAFIEEKSNFVRFMKLDNKNKFKTIYPKIRGTTEKFKSISFKDPVLIKSHKFADLMKNDRLF